jgi:hypothetical protein
MHQNEIFLKKIIFFLPETFEKTLKIEKSFGNFFGGRGYQKN